MVSRHNTSKRIHFGGLIWFWAVPRKPNESSHQRFIRIYESLRDAVEHKTSAPQARQPWWRWKIVRIHEPGRWFLGISHH